MLLLVPYLRGGCAAAQEDGGKFAGQHNGNVMHWVVYIPPPEQRPLRIGDLPPEALLPYPAFTMEAWGGVVLYSPSKVRFLPCLAVIVLVMTY